MRNYGVAVYLWIKRDRDREFVGRERAKIGGIIIEVIKPPRKSNNKHWCWKYKQGQAWNGVWSIEIFSPKIAEITARFGHLLGEFFFQTFHLPLPSSYLNNGIYFQLNNYKAFSYVANQPKRIRRSELILNEPSLYNDSLSLLCSFCF